ncbi:hypothetical protein [Mariniphaga sp.]|uniref:hypothetical protein n=1 Tax=Mariniphaga sp. TaxID=1954475 RepID=UPI003561C6FD
MIDCTNLIKLIDILIWPLVVIGALLIYRKALSNFISGFSQRITKLSVFNVSVEMAALSAATPPWSDSNIQQSSEMLGGEVSSTTLTMLFNQISTDKSWDYLIVDLKEGRTWLVSRLFIFSVFLTAMRGLKCIVLVQSQGEYYRRLLGLASPEALQKNLAQSYPWLETSLNDALNQPKINHLGPELKPTIAGEIIRTFIENQNMRLQCDPEEVIKTENNCQTPKDQLPPDVKPGDWVRLGDYEIWEHTHWLNLDINRVSVAITKSFYEKDSASYTKLPGESNEKQIKELMQHKAPFVALTNSKNEFISLIDRNKLAALIGENLMK